MENDRLMTIGFSSRIPIEVTLSRDRIFLSSPFFWNLSADQTHLNRVEKISPSSTNETNKCRSNQRAEMREARPKGD